MELAVVIGYFGMGVVSLYIFDRLTKRIRRKLVPAAAEAQDKLVATGTFVSSRVAIGVTVVALMLFWPLVIGTAVYDAVVGTKKGVDRG